MLRKIRIGVSLLCLVWITFYFLDFAGFSGTSSFLPRIQFVPVLLSGSLMVLSVLLLLTLLFGRIYCSSVCPMGIFQDIVTWISKRRNKKKKYGYRRNKGILRWSIVVVVGITFYLEFALLLGLTDPYSAYGRMVTNVFKPVYIAGNNLLAWIFTRFDNYTFYYIEVTVLSMAAFVVGVITFLGIGFLAYRYGRLYCNTVCPVGTVLGFFSRYALFRVRIDKDKCNGCGLCGLKCKASCIDSKEHRIDYSRCVDCFDCLDICRQQALHFGLKRPEQPEIKTTAADESRRMFLSAALLTAVAVPTARAEESAGALLPYKPYKRQHPLSPPGSRSAAHLMQHCTSCHLCVTKCPSHVLKPAFMEYGLGGMMQPVMSFEKGFCNFDCTVCSDVCPNGAILPLTVEEKHVTQVGKVVFLEENCIVRTDETNCGACSEHCPTQAVTMVPYKNGLTIPHVNPDICVGCGGCEYVCPVRPFRAIHIEGNEVHQQALPFREAEKKEVELDSFGF